MSRRNLVTAALAALPATVLVIPKWPLGLQGTDYWTATTALGTVGAAIVAVVYVSLTHGLWREAATQREGDLMLRLINGYDKLRDDVDLIRRYYMECAASGPTDPIARFREEVGGLDHLYNERAEVLDESRFRVSRFFVRTRKLVRAGFLSETVVVAALDKRAVEYVFLQLVDPLDEAKAGKRFSTHDREFYKALLCRYPEEDE